MPKSNENKLQNPSAPKYSGVVKTTPDKYKGGRVGTTPPAKPDKPTKPDKGNK